MDELDSELEKFCHGCQERVELVNWHICPMRFKSGLPDGHGIRSLYIRTTTED